MADGVPLNGLLFATRRLRVRTWEEHDLDAFARLTRDQRVMRFVGDGKVFTLARTARWIRRTRQNNQRGFGAFAATMDDAVVGWCSFGPGEDGPFPEVVEFGYALAPAHWGQGLGGELAAALVQFLKHRWPGVVLTASVDPENVASIRILERLELQAVREGVDGDGLPTRWYRLEWSEPSFSGN